MNKYHDEMVGAGIDFRSATVPSSQPWLPRCDGTGLKGLDFMVASSQF